MKKRLRKNALNKLLSPVLDYTTSFVKPKRVRSGAIPGSLLYTGEKWREEVTVELIQFDANSYEETHISNKEEYEKLVDHTRVNWINISGLHNTEIISEFGNHWSLDKLTLEDILDVNQRPKFQEYPSYDCVITKSIRFDKELLKIDLEHVTIVIKENKIFSFQEKAFDLFDPIKTRIANPTGNARLRGADYLWYMLIDIIVDYYFEVIDEILVAIEKLENEVIQNPERRHLLEIQHLKKDCLFIRNLISPLITAVKTMLTKEDGCLTEKTKFFLRDTLDHLQNIHENIEMYREMSSHLMDLYISQQSNKMNEVMKVLTVIATIFIPLTFLAGIYGMNFENFPELQWAWMYPKGFYIISFATIIGMVSFMRYKKWL